jgi:nucleoside-diphosphate-sugar epimerase
MTTRVLITGAGGFIGRHAARHLRDQGLEVRAMTRSEGKPLPDGIEPAVVRDLDDAAVVERAMRGCDAVVHLAGRAHVLRDQAADPLAAFRRVNVEGTKQVLEASIRAGVSRFVLMSSVGAVAIRAETPLTESIPPAPVTPYGVSKLEAEQCVRDRAQAGVISVSILRPPMVYGPGMKGNPLRLMQAIERGIPLPLGAVNRRRSAIFVGNLVAAVATLVDVSAATGTFFIKDDEDLSARELIRRMAHALGLPARLISVPVPLMRGLARITDIITLRGERRTFSETVARLTEPLLVDDSKLRASTGFRPLHSTDEGIRLTTEWFQRQRSSFTSA